jgi:hypothetical protein
MSKKPTETSKQTPSSIKSWLERNAGWLGALGALLGVVVILAGVGRWLLSAPNVAIAVRDHPVAFPTVITGDFQKAFDRSVILALAKSDSTWRPLIALDDFLRETKSFVTVGISNNGDRTIQNVEIRLRGLHRLTGYSVGGDLLLASERQAIRDSTRFDATTGILTIGMLSRLGPKRTINVSVWGEGAFPNAFGGEPVTVLYDGGTGKLVRTVEIRGGDAFVYENAALLALMIVALNLAWIAVNYDKPKVEAKE